MLNNEPVVTINAIVAVITTIISALVTTGVLHVSQDQQSQLVGIIVAVGAFIATFVSRSLVTPVTNPKDNEGNTLS